MILEDSGAEGDYRRCVGWPEGVENKEENAKMEELLNRETG